MVFRLRDGTRDGYRLAFAGRRYTNDQLAGLTAREIEALPGKAWPRFSDK